MSHNQNPGPSGAFLLHRLNHPLHGLLIEGGEWLIHEEEGAAADEGSAESEAILLADAEIESKIGEDVVESDTAGDQFMKDDLFESFVDVLFGDRL